MVIFPVAYEEVHMRTDIRRVSLRGRSPQDLRWGLERVLGFLGNGLYFSVGI
jgi:hypothetical protein